MRADLVVDQLAPVFQGPIWVWLILVDRSGNPRDVEVVELTLKETVVGETAGFCGGVESVKGGVTGSWIGIVVEAVARVRKVGATIWGLWEGYVARARRYGTFEIGDVVAFDAEADCIGARRGLNDSGI